MRISTQLTKQRGASTLEVSLTLAPILLVCLLGLEVVHAHQVKQLVSLALHEASRRASVTHADRKEIDQAFTQALSPVFTPPGQHASPLERQKAVSARYQRLYALPLWQLELTELSSRGANTHELQAVRLDLAYVHEPLQPWLRQALRRILHWLHPTPDALEASAQRQGLVVIRLTRRVAIHASQAKDITKRLIEGGGQRQTALTEHQSMRPPKPEHQPSLEQRLAARSLSQPLSSALGPAMSQTRPHALSQRDDRAPTSKATTLRRFKQESKNTELCGVLLCCPP